MATQISIQTADVISNEIKRQGLGIEGAALAARVKPRTFRTHLQIGSLTLDEVVAVSKVLGMTPSEILRRAEHTPDDDALAKQAAA